VLIAVDPSHGLSRSSSFTSQHQAADYARRRMSLYVAALQQGKVCIL